MKIDMDGYRADLHAAQDEVSELYLLRYVWKNLLTMLESQPELPHNVLVSNWLITCYTRTLAAGIRRQAEPTESRQVIGSILRRVQTHPEDFTRESCGFDAVETRSGKVDPWMSFAIVANGPLDPSRVEAVVTELERGSAVAHRWVHKRMNHLERAEAKLSFDDLESSLAALRQAVMFLHALLNQGARMVSMTPNVPSNWLSMFSKPWYDPARMQPIDPAFWG